MIALQKFVNTLPNADDSTTNIFIDLAKVIHFKKDDIIVKAGEKQKNFYIIKAGIIKSYYYDEFGKTYIRNLFTKMSATGDVGALLNNTPAKLYYDCFTDCEVYEINFEKFMTSVRENHQFSIVFGSLLSKVILKFESKIYDLSVLNATERYLKLKEEKPEIEHLVPQYIIASLLNISAVQLSRIRKDIANSNTA